MRARKPRLRASGKRENGTGISSATHPEWRDPHKGLWLAGLVIPLTPFIAWGLVSLLGPGVFWLAGMLTIAVVP